MKINTNNPIEIQETTCAAFAVPESGCPGYIEVMLIALFAIIRDGIARQILPKNIETIERTNAKVAEV